MLECNSQTLSKAISRVAPACDPKSPHEPYKAVHFDAPKAGLVRLIGSDGVVSVETTIEAGGKWSPFAMAAKDVASKVRGFPSEKVKLDATKRGVKVSGDGTARVHTLPIFDVATIGQGAPKKSVATITASALQKALASIGFAIGQDSTAPGYGFRLAIIGGKARFEATNGHCLAIAEVSATGAFEAVLPPRVVTVVRDTFEGDVSISVEGNHVAFASGAHCVSVLTAGATFPPVSDLQKMLGSPKVWAEFDRDAAVSAVRACELANSGVLLTVDGGEVRFSAEANGAESNDAIGADTNGNGQATLNAGYLVAALGSIDCPRARIEWSDSLKPITIRQPDGADQWQQAMIAQMMGAK